MAHAIPEISNVSAEQFHNEILPAGKPVVMRGLVSDWPIVKAGKEGPRAFCDYVRRFDRGQEVNTVFGPPSIKGRIFYNLDMSGLNCRMGFEKLTTTLDYLLEHQDDDPAPTMAIQSVIVPQYLPGLEKENILSILNPGIEPRIWLGGKTTVAAHYDSSQNIACCLAGLRQFTLFSPDQIGNLYVGPFENTPAGAVISMVDFDRPDYEKYPRLKLAEEAALVAELEPGDAIHIPYNWWHQVKSLASVNALMNYWWGGPNDIYGDPRNALFHAIMSIRNLPPNYRDTWKALFDYYVFESSGNTGAHLPAQARGILGELNDAQLKLLKTMLARALSKNM